MELADPWFFEDVCYEEGYTAVCGVDEAGAGPLAGPVYAAAVILPHGASIAGLNDSKKCTARQRDRLYEEIVKTALAYAVASVDAAEIDEIDILNARMKAMQAAIDALPVPADFALIDGNRDHGSRIAIRTAHKTVVGGDGRSASIAAASVLAKVSRDRYCTGVMATAYPAYRFEKHKGYGTKLHYEMLDKYGASPLHRKSFLKKWEGAK